MQKADGVVNRQPGRGGVEKRLRCLNADCEGAAEGLRRDCQEQNCRKAEVSQPVNVES